MKGPVKDGEFVGLTFSDVPKALQKQGYEAALAANIVLDDVGRLPVDIYLTRKQLTNLFLQIHGYLHNTQAEPCEEQRETR